MILKKQGGTLLMIMSIDVKLFPVNVFVLVIYFHVPNQHTLFGNNLRRLCDTWPSSDKNYAYVLSVRDLDKKTDEPSVRHYKIAVENDRYRINPKIYFDDVLQLIEFYKRDRKNTFTYTFLCRQLICYGLN